MNTPRRSISDYAAIGGLILMAIGLGAGGIEYARKSAGTDSATAVVVEQHGREIVEIKTDLNVVKAQNQISITDRANIHDQIHSQAQQTDRNVDSFRSEVTHRMDRQEEKLDRIGERLGVPAKP